MSQKTNSRIVFTVQIFTDKGAPTTIAASYPIGDESDQGKILRFGVSRFIEEKVPAKHWDNLHHD